MTINKQALDAALAKLADAKANGDPAKYVCVISVADARAIHGHVAALKLEVERLKGGADILATIVGNANEAMPMGPFDCIDNDGDAYQSAAFQDALKRGRDFLARAALTPTDSGKD